MDLLGIALLVATLGVPSLFSDLSPLYDHPGKADMLEQLILELAEIHGLLLMLCQFPRQMRTSVSFMTLKVVFTFMPSLVMRLSHYSEVGSCLKDLLKRKDHLQ
ncbi:uncharacterized protein LOC105766621 isoform X2 [Gossypium raimondii]|uniref:uncharacterized protein LOC105766621 isoform X2 n=1 Tax=Gossypium raimondii TaxID=29730 RepID=UPI00063AFF1F|nr:uncharacterized protein LOC105766621 isoform X2 [Gossypium raimondii]